VAAPGLGLLDGGLKVNNDVKFGWKIILFGSHWRTSQFNQVLFRESAGSRLKARKGCS